MTQPTPTAAPPALLNITLGVMLALMLGWFFHIASGVLVPMVLGLMISYVVMALNLLNRDTEAPQPTSCWWGKEEWERGLLSQCVPLFLFFLALFWKLTTSPEATSTRR